MSLPHLDCTKKERREQICQDYEVHADDCIVLYGGRIVHSDANKKEIKDRYYQFSCINKSTKDKYVIVCGGGAARHFCSLIHEQMPHAMDPFVGNDDGPGGNRGGNGDGDDHNRWNLLRRQFYYAVQLFITRYQEILTPGTKIFKLLQGIVDERYISLPPQEFQYQQFIDVVSAFHTNMPQIRRELEQHGRLRAFDFTNLANELERILPDCENIFLE